MKNVVTFRTRHRLYGNGVRFSLTDNEISAGFNFTGAVEDWEDRNEESLTLVPFREFDVEVTTDLPAEVVSAAVTVPPEAAAAPVSVSAA
jgi:hypothetical protein